MHLDADPTYRLVMDPCTAGARCWLESVDPDPSAELTGTLERARDLARDYESPIDLLDARGIIRFRVTADGNYTRLDGDGEVARTASGEVDMGFFPLGTALHRALLGLGHRAWIEGDVFAVEAAPGLDCIPEADWFTAEEAAASERRAGRRYL